MYEVRELSEKMISFRLTEEQIEVVDKSASEAGVSRSDYIKMKVFNGYSISKTYTRFELLDWVVRNRNGLSSTAHYLAMILAHQYVDWNERNRSKHWGQIRRLHSQLAEQTGLSVKTIARASAELKKSGMWDYTPGRKGHMSTYVPLMKVLKQRVSPIADG